MKTFYSTNFEGHNPVGVSAICRARDEGSAYNKLAEVIMARGLPDPRTDPEWEVEELEEGEAIVLQDGEY